MKFHDYVAIRVWYNYQMPRKVSHAESLSRCTLSWRKNARVTTLNQGGISVIRDTWRTTHVSAKRCAFWFLTEARKTAGGSLIRPLCMHEATALTYTDTNGCYTTLHDTHFLTWIFHVCRNKAFLLLSLWEILQQDFSMKALMHPHCNFRKFSLLALVTRM
jgi:hypothetical protein